MKHFASLYTQLDQTTKTNAKVSALAQYFEQSSDEDQLMDRTILSHRYLPNEQSIPPY